MNIFYGVVMMIIAAIYIIPSNFAGLVVVSLLATAGWEIIAHGFNTGCVSLSIICLFLLCPFELLLGLPEITEATKRLRCKEQKHAKNDISI